MKQTALQIIRVTAPIVLGLLIFVGYAVSSPAADPRANSLAPGGAHPLGTDPYGHDLLSLMLRAALKSGGEAIWATSLTTVLSITIGIMAARRPRGGFDTVQALLARLLDGLGPFVIAACVFTLLPRLNMWMAGAFLSLFVWPNLSGIVRAEVIGLSSSTYIEAIRAIGASPIRVVVVHLVPAMIDRLLSPVAALVGAYVGLFGALGFLGVGVATELSLGFIVYDGMAFLQSAPWYFASGVSAFVLLLAIIAACAVFANRAVRDRGHVRPRPA